MKPTRVLFVCLGNICRSPTAHGVFEHMVSQEGLSHVINTDSAGTAHWHEGKAPDSRTVAAAKRRGYDLSHLRGRQCKAEDFAGFDYILAMDNHNLSELEQLSPLQYPGHLGLFLEFATQAQVREVPDPYYGGSDGFNYVVDLVEDACRGLLGYIRKTSAS
ncbi:MAG: protein-tyrosine phosphatase [Lentisphaeria bacterium]|jgi:protein-tyrosine phosphatase